MSKSYRKASKTVAMFFVVLFVWNSLFSYLFYYIDRQLIRSHVEQMIRNNQYPEAGVVVIDKTNRKDFIRENGNELSRNGNMYDIISEKVNDKGEVEIYCISDKDETLLLGNLQSKTKSENRAPGKLLKGYCLSPFIQVNNSIALNLFSIPENNFSLYTPDLTSVWETVMVPPPDRN